MALGWKGEESQVKRFEVLAMLGDLNNASVLDSGCGYGDLKAFLDQRFKAIRYIGVDLMPEFITRAREIYHAEVDTWFYEADFNLIEFPRVDFVLASGVLSYRCSIPDFYMNMIRKMYEAAAVAVGFNMLDVQIFRGHGLLVGHDVERIVDFCRSLATDVKVIRGYLEEDFTVFLFKESQA